MKNATGLLIVVCILLAPIISFGQSAKEAIMALKKLEARCQSGISYREYSSALGEAKFPVNLFRESEEASKNIKLTESILRAMGHYENAKSYWDYKFSIWEYGINKDSEKRIIEMYPDADKDANQGGARNDLMPGKPMLADFLLPVVWREASEELKKTTALLLESENKSKKPKDESKIVKKKKPILLSDEESKSKKPKDDVEKLKEEINRLKAENLNLRDQQKKAILLSDEESKSKKVKDKAPKKKSIPPTYTDPTTGMEFVMIPAGSFFMGSPENEPGRIENEGPQHRVEITRPFYLGKYEVTIGQFRKFVQETGYKTEAEKEGGLLSFITTLNKEEKMEGIYWNNVLFSQTDRHPVIGVSWNDAQAFIKWLNKKSIASYRLPTEAEWEYAARGGTSTSRYWGDDPDKACQYGNVPDRTVRQVIPENTQAKAECEDGYVFTSPVGTFRPNAFGLYDMLGNAWEWCEDWYDKNYYQNSPIQNPSGPLTGSNRIIRGGGCIFAEINHIRSAARLDTPSYYRNLDVGFRLVRLE